MTLDMSHEQLLSAVERLESALLETPGEADGQLPPKVIEQLEELGLVGIFAPQVLGGAELDMRPGLDLLSRVSYINGSLGWILMTQCMFVALTGAFLADGAVSKIFADGIPAISGGGGPLGKAIPTDGGYRLSGSWAYGSGMEHARWVIAGGMVYPDGLDSPPRKDPVGDVDARFFVVPRQAVMLHGDWDVLGLRATRSFDYRIDDQPLSDDFSFAIEPPTPKRGGAVFRLGLYGFSALGHTAWALGVGKCALDELAVLVRTGRGGFALLAKSESFHEHYAEAAGSYLAAQALAHETLREVQKTLDRDEPLTLSDMSLLRLMVNRVTFAMSDLSLFAYREAGGVGLREGTIQRCFRDMCAATQHQTVVRRQLVNVGLERLGLAEGKLWKHHGLVDRPLVEA
jgi:alkylation response protein AidB-like acyl-CoA dehydrogenase